MQGLFVTDASKMWVIKYFQAYLLKKIISGLIFRQDLFLMCYFCLLFIFISFPHAFSFSPFPFLFNPFNGSETLTFKLYFHSLNMAGRICKVNLYYNHYFKKIKGNCSLMAMLESYMWYVMVKFCIL